jgi:hypothetical protein
MSQRPNGSVFYWRSVKSILTKSHLEIVKTPVSYLNKAATAVNAAPAMNAAGDGPQAPHAPHAPQIPHHSFSIP